MIDYTSDEIIRIQCNHRPHKREKEGQREKRACNKGSNGQSWRENYRFYSAGFEDGGSQKPRITFQMLEKARK